MTQSQEWLDRLQRPFVANLASVTSRLRDGLVVEHPELSSALLLAMRQGNVRQLKVLFSSAAPQLLEDCLGEAWRTAGALGLTLDKDTRTIVRNGLVSLRYRLSVEEPKPTRNPVDLWDRVDKLQQDVQRLEEKLGQLQDGGYADCCVLLAKRCALAIHWLKSKEAFSKTCDVVAWGETEFLLAQFVEAQQSEPMTLAIIVATPQRTAAHLRCFREQVEQHVMKIRDSPAPQPEPKGKSKYPEVTPDAVTERLDPDSDHARLREDFTLLRDFRSLRKITEALEAACQSLELDDQPWFEWGSLGLRAGLFVAGEAMKNSWQSPNLSCRWTDMLWRMAPDGVKNILTGVRNCLEHDKRDNNATAGFEKRKELVVALKKVLNVARVLLREALYAVLDDRWDPTADFGGDKLSSGRIRSLFSNLNFGSVDADIITELIDSNAEDTEDINDIIDELKQIVKDSCNIDCYLYNGKKERANGIYLLRRHIALEKKLSTPHSLKLSCINHRETDDTMGAFQAYLESQGQVPLDRTIAQLTTALKAIPEEGSTLLIEYAVLGVLREVASRWHSRDKAVPTPVPYATALVGRSLRNYLNHNDNIVDLCIDMAAEQVAFRAVLCKGEGVFDLLRGAKPKQCDLVWSRKEDERLLRLMELKGTAFNYAREGELLLLQRLLRVEQELQGVVNFTDCRSRSLLTVAAQAGEWGVVRWLREHGIKLPSRIGISPDASFEVLRIAAYAGQISMVSAILRSNPGIATVSKKPDDSSTNSGLDSAAAGGREAVVDLLLQHGARPTPGFTLSAAARSGSVPTVRRLLAVRDPAPPSDEDCWSAAEGAAKVGAEQVFFVLLNELLSRGLAMEGAPAQKLLKCAARGGSSAIALRLLDCCGPAALDWGLVPRGRSLLDGAAAFGHVGLVRDLLARGADPLRRDDTSHTALHQVWSVGVIDALMEHIDAGHSLRTGRGEAMPPLYIAAQCGYLEAVEALIAHGADLEAGGLGGEAPLLAAAALGHTRVVKCLLEHGARQIPDPTGDTPLIAAAHRGQMLIVETLLAYHTPNDDSERERLLEVLRHQGQHNMTALHVAVLSCSRSVVKHLLKREWDLLDPIWQKAKEKKVHKKGVPVSARAPIVFTRDTIGRTPLVVAVVTRGEPSVTETLLEYMGPSHTNKMMAFAGKDLVGVRELVLEALVNALVHHPNWATANNSTARVLIRWLEERGEVSDDFKSLRSQLEELSMGGRDD